MLFKKFACRPGFPQKFSMLQAPGIYAAGDNSFHQLWNNKFILSPHFVRCEDFPCKLSSIQEISLWNQSIAILRKDGSIIFKEEDKDIIESNAGSVKSICCLDNCAIALLNNEKLIEVPSMKKLKPKSVKKLSCSPNIIAFVNKKDHGFIIKGDRFSDPVKVANHVTAIGCTCETVFIAQNSRLFKIENDDLALVEIQIPRHNANIISISCSEDDALFIDDIGNLYRYDFTSISQIFGLPQIAFASIGPQHSAAISFDGALFTWGFNPSGQLGIGTDRSTKEPNHVFDNVAYVGCGTQHTIVMHLENCQPEIPQLMNKVQFKKPVMLLPNQSTRISRAELLS